MNWSVSDIVEGRGSDVRYPGSRPDPDRLFRCEYAACRRTRRRARSTWSAKKLTRNETETLLQSRARESVYRKPGIEDCHGNALPGSALTSVRARKAPLRALAERVQNTPARPAAFSRQRAHLPLRSSPLRLSRRSDDFTGRKNRGRVIFLYHRDGLMTLSISRIGLVKRIIVVLMIFR